MALRPVNETRMKLARPELIILDFDGVVVDSELLANALLGEFLTGEGLPTTTEQAIERYMGRRWIDCEERIAESFGRPLPPDFHARYRTFENGRMRRDVRPVPGIETLLRHNRDTRFCVASSSNISWLDHNADKFALRSYLDTNLFSASEVANGKPAPDVFLYAAQRMGVAPSRCVVICMLSLSCANVAGSLKLATNASRIRVFSASGVPLGANTPHQA